MGVGVVIDEIKPRKYTSFCLKVILPEDLPIPRGLWELREDGLLAFLWRETCSGRSDDLSESWHLSWHQKLPIPQIYYGSMTVFTSFSPYLLMDRYIWRRVERGSLWEFQQLSQLRTARTAEQVSILEGSWRDEHPSHTETLGPLTGLPWSSQLMLALPGLWGGMLVWSQSQTTAHPPFLFQKRAHLLPSPTRPLSLARCWGWDPIHEVITKP